MLWRGGIYNIVYIYIVDSLSFFLFFHLRKTKKEKGGKKGGLVLLCLEKSKLPRKMGKEVGAT